MDTFFQKPLAYFKDHWHIGIAGTANAAELLDINPNTLKTRLARGQALVLRDADGRTRSSLTFTGYHLVYNLIQDRLLRYGFAVDADEKGFDYLTYTYSEWGMNQVLSAPHHLEAVIRFKKGSDGQVQPMAFENGGVEDWTGDAVMILPIGTMISRLAVSVYMRTGAPGFSTHYLGSGPAVA